MQHIITSFEIIDHGIEHSQYFQGCGTSFTSYRHVATGIGGNFAEAYEDATEMMAQGAEDIDFDGFDARVLKDIGRRSLPKLPALTSKHNEECYYRVSIRYNLASKPALGGWSVVVGNIGTVHTGDSEAHARKAMDDYIELSDAPHGRAPGEDVTLMRGCEIVGEHIGRKSTEDFGTAYDANFGENDSNGQA